jgi:hypothetical protein
MIIFNSGSGIGNRISSWLKSLPFWRWISDYVDDYLERQKTMIPQLKELTGRAFRTGDLKLIVMCLWMWCAIYLAGGSLWLPADIEQYIETTSNEIDEFNKDPSVYLARKIDEAMKSAGVQEMAETVGSLITQPVLTLFEHYATTDSPDVHEFSRAFHGYMISLGWAGGIVDAALKVPLGERAPSVGNALMSMYWSLGLGFLGWQTLAPLLSAGLQPNLTRYYNKLYRPKRFSASEIRDLFALGKITAGQLNEAMREEGWQDRDIQTWLELSYRNLSEGVIWELYESNVLGQAQVEERLRAAGYNPDDIPLLFRVHPKSEESDTGKFLRSTAKNAFKSGLIDETEFRQILVTLGYAQREIDLQIATLTEEKDVELKELTVNQIKQLYVARLIDQVEARHHLDEQDISPGARDKLVELWDYESQPKAVRLNRSTITAAYREGVIERSRMTTLLQSESGYNSEQAELIAKTEDAYIERLGAGIATGPKALSLAMLKDFAQAGLITRSDAEQRTELEQFTTTDRPLIVEWLFFQSFEQPLELSVDMLAEAYVFGLITREELTARIAVKEVLAEDIETFIRTVELNNPEVFGEFVPRYVAVPSTGQLDLALQRGLIDEKEYRDRLTRMGFNEEGVTILLFNAQYQTPVEPKKFTDATILRLYRINKLTQPAALDRLVKNGYVLDDAKLLLEAEIMKPEDTEIAQMYQAGYIELGAVLAYLTEEGFSPDEIQEWVDKYS